MAGYAFWISYLPNWNSVNILHMQPKYASVVVEELHISNNSIEIMVLCTSREDYGLHYNNIFQLLHNNSIEELHVLWIWNATRYFNNITIFNKVDTIIIITKKKIYKNWVFFWKWWFPKCTHLLPHASSDEIIYDTVKDSQHV